MRRVKGKQTLIRKNMMAVVGICLSFYFSYHLLAGHRGYFSLISLQHQIAELQELNHQYSAKREAIQCKVVMMRPGSIDRDLLEERARYVLGYQRDDEIILIQDRS